MCQAEYFQELRRATSDRRLERYLRQSSGGDERQAFGAYLWNAALCESLYPALQGVEVTLRNNIHQAASAKFEDEFWFKNRLIRREREKIRELDEKLGAAAEPGRYISECQFGFWVGLFRGEYEQIFWTALLRTVFPHAPGPRCARAPLHQRLDRIRLLRNRVFHYEPVSHIPGLTGQHRAILETIEWLNPSMARLVESVDRFPEEYDGGIRPYEMKVAAAEQQWMQSGN